MISTVFQMDRVKCFGCRSCEQSCNKNAISMEYDTEGFIYPVINNELCISCGKCITKCPANQNINVKERITPKRYALILKNKEILEKSSSGGLFSGIAKYFLENRGIVFGASFDNELNVHQIAISKVNDLYKLQGSKYVTSDTKETFIEVKNALFDNKQVLYSGTPCQIAGLRNFLGKEYTNLFTMDLICHGVPSLKLWMKYLEWLGKKNNGKIIYYGFRDKDVSGWSCGGKVKTKTKTKTKTIEGFNDPFYHAFLKCETYRESCYSCPYANSSNRIGDISMGDFWGTDKEYPKIPSSEGISLCSINTLHGLKLFEEIKNEFDVYICPEDESLKHNIAYNQPSIRPLKRDTIYSGIDGNLNKYFRKLNPFPLPRRIISTVLPKSIKNLMKRIINKGE